MTYNAVIFDLFGTLVDDFGSSAGQLNSELAAALGLADEPFTQLWRQTTGMRTIGDFQTVEESIEYVCEAMGAHVSADQMANAVDIRLKYMKEALKPRPEAVDTLAQLKKEGRKTGLLSNCSIEIPLLWHETDLASVIDAAVFSSRERLKKPDPRIYHLVCERLGVKPGSCLYVADGENYELTAAENIGLHAVLIRTFLQETRGELRQEAREWQGKTIFSLAAVLELVK